jgi:hypothetical protein
MSFDAQRLYDLLPALYRLRDREQGAPLRALLAVMAEEIGALEQNLEQLYDDQFIETCAAWVVPYIGDLIGVRGLHGVVPQVSSPRAEVANTIRLRRRKGTAAVLEELARDVTGWPARVVECFADLGWTQFMNHVRVVPPRGGWLSLRDQEACERITHARGAFDSTAHTVDVRRAASGRGRHNIPNVLLFLWRLQAYPLARSNARAVGANRFTFNALGLDAPLYNRPQSELEITHLAEEINLPATLRRRPLFEELEAQRQALVENRPVDAVYFGAMPVVDIWLNDEPAPLPAAELTICDLSDWRVPPSSKTYTLPDGSTVARKIRAAIDPVLGRLTFAAAEQPQQVLVSHAYGFSTDLGGGPYDRAASVAAALDRPVTWQVGVSQEIAAAAGEIFATLQAAVAAWNAQPAGTVGIIAIMDNRSHALSGDVLSVPAGSRLLIVAAAWPKVSVPDALPPQQRIVGQVSADERRPHLRGSLAVAGSGGTGELFLDGLLLEGALQVLAGNLGALRVSHCTVVPGVGQISVAASVTDLQQRNDSLQLSLAHCICGPLVLPPTLQRLQVTDSILASGSAHDDKQPVIAAPGTSAELERCTVFGTVQLRTLEASNCIFGGVLEVAQRQSGCVRFSHLPLTSKAPRSFRCVPEDAADATRVQPQFTSRRYGDPAYAQLSLRAALELRQGADDEAEMGAFHDLFQPQRATNLRVRLEEYLRFGLEAGVVYVS